MLVKLEHLLPRAYRTVNATLTEGAKDHLPGAFERLGVTGNIGRAVKHLILWWLGFRGGEDHLAHGAARILMALECDRAQKSSTGRKWRWRSSRWGSGVH